MYLDPPKTVNTDRSSNLMLRRATVLLAVLFFVPSTVTAQATTAPEGPRETRLLDPAGDVRIIGPATNQSDPEGRYAYIDVVEAWISNETYKDLELGVRFKKLDASQFGPNAGFTLRFLVGQASYWVGRGPDVFACVGGYGIQLNRPGGGYSTSCGLQPQADPATNTLRFKVSRDALKNETEYPFGPGVTLRNLHVESVANVAGVNQLGPTTSAYNTNARDRGPDAGFAPSYDSILGNISSQGGLRLFAKDPIRISNGESTTLVYPVDAINELNQPTTLHLSVASNHSAWNIRVPARLQLPALTTVRFPVILSMGFEHRHGELATFRVRAEDAGDPTRWSSIGLGVFWLDTPQPAGHHDKAWLHTGYSSTTQTPTGSCATLGTWFNPLTPDPQASEAPAAGCTWDAPTAYASGQTFEWGIGLRPELAIGLDFDVTRKGTFRVDIQGSAGASTTTLELELLYCDPSKTAGRAPGSTCPGEWIKIGAGKSAAKSLGASSKATYEVEFPIEPAADYLPYQRKNDLKFNLRLLLDRAQCPPNRAAADCAPLLLPKSSEIILPLVEYHDPIDQAFENVGALELTPLSPFEKPVNPGRSAVFDFALVNSGAHPQRVRLTIEGHNRDWARVAGADTPSVPSKESRNVSIVVDVPEDAGPGERAELFVVAENVDDPNVVAISRLRATVVDPEVQDVPNEEATGGDDGDIPSVPLVWLLAALFGLAVRRRARVKP